MLNLLNQIQIVLVEPTHPGNIGAVARSMKTMGLSKLVMVNPKKFPHYEASKRAAGAESVLDDARVVSHLSDALNECTLVLGTSVRDREVTWPTYDPRVSADRLMQHLNVVDSIDSVKVAILFGRESSGLTNQEMDLCHSQIRIPANDEYSSLNLASAVQIITYELRMRVLQESHSSKLENDDNSSLYQRQQLATLEQQQDHIKYLQKTLEAIDFG